MHKAGRLAHQLAGTLVPSSVWCFSLRLQRLIKRSIRPTPPVMPFEKVACTDTQDNITWQRRNLHGLLSKQITFLIAIMDRTEKTMEGTPQPLFSNRGISELDIANGGHFSSMNGLGYTTARIRMERICSYSKSVAQMAATCLPAAQDHSRDGHVDGWLRVRRDRRGSRSRAILGAQCSCTRPGGHIIGHSHCGDMVSGGQSIERHTLAFSSSIRSDGFIWRGSARQHHHMDQTSCAATHCSSGYCQ
jgi:hypothetical protein